MEKKKSTKKRKPAPLATEAEVHVEPESAAAASVHSDPGEHPDAGVSAIAEAAARSECSLEPSLQIKDVEEAHRQLMEMLAGDGVLTVNISRVSAVDTAGIQLLLAFQTEVVKRGVSLEFRGESAAITHALTALGLRDAMRIAN
jgi:anti-anti-sigma regulatory factor